jgi:hypothetical protein
MMIMPGDQAVDFLIAMMYPSFIAITGIDTGMMSRVNIVIFLITKMKAKTILWRNWPHKSTDTIFL